MPVHELYDIREYFQRLAKGDTSAFETIFYYYKKRVFGVAFKMLKCETEAEEIVQDVFLSIWLAKSRLSLIKDPDAYLFTITYNTVYSHLKKASRNKVQLTAIVHRISQIQNTTDETIAANETGKLINAAVQQLPPQQRVVYDLSKLEGLSYDEIAGHLQLSRNTVRNHLAEAMKAIRIFLKKAAMIFLSLAVFLF